MTTLKIMVVEDDMLIGMLLGEMLESMGHQVCAIERTEDDAVRAADQFHPDLMIVDAWLEGGSGMSAVAKILRNQLIPHVFVTGDTSRVLALRPGAIVIQKPFRETDLAHGIERALAAA